MPEGSVPICTSCGAEMMKTADGEWKCPICDPVTVYTEDEDEDVET